MTREITGRTELISLLGYPIRHTQSPLMHNEALKQLGLDYVYLCFEVDNDNLKTALDAIRALKIRGSNVTMPNKIAVIDYLDDLSEEARLCGAVNTIVNDNGKLTGHITDGIGYIRALEDSGTDVKGKKITVAGAGGVGKTIQVSLAMAGAAEISVFNKKDKFWERAQETVALINEKTSCRASLFDIDDLETLKPEMKESDIVTNATGMGMKPLEGMTFVPDESYFNPASIVTDVVYVPTETEFLRLARKAGCKAMNGQSMMLFQGAESFRLWTGKDMPIEHMKKYLCID